MLDMLLAGRRRPTPVADKTLLLLQAKTGFVDVATGKKITAVGKPRITTTQKVFTEQSSFDFLAGRVDIGALTDFNFTAAGEFTIEFWAYPTSVGSGLWFISKGTGTTSCVKTYNNQLYLQNQGSSASAPTDAYVPLNRWVHFAVVHKNNWYGLLIDGVQRVTFTDAANGFGDPTQLLRIGGYEAYSACYMDQIRVSRVARYWGPVFPPSAVFTVD